MRCFRVQQPEAVRYLAPMLMDMDGINKEEFLKTIYLSLKQQNPAMYLAYVVNDQETAIVGFGIGTANDATDFIWLHQVWVHPQEGGAKAVDMLWEKLRSWAYHIGKRRVRAETTRSPEIFARRHGFRIVTSVIEHYINDPADFLSAVTRSDNGRQQQSNDARSDDNGPGGSRQIPVEVSAGASSGSAATRGNGAAGPAEGNSVSVPRPLWDTGSPDASGSVSSGDGDLRSYQQSSEPWTGSGEQLAGSARSNPLAPARQPDGPVHRATGAGVQGRERSAGPELHQRSELDASAEPDSGNRGGVAGSAAGNAGPSVDEFLASLGRTDLAEPQPVAQPGSPSATGRT